MAIQSTGGASQAGNTQDSGHFEDGLKGAQNSDLAKMAGPNSGLDATEKTAALKQLVSNLLEGKDSGKSDGASGSGDSGSASDDLKKLLQKLLGGAGGADGASDSGDSGDSGDSDDIAKLLKKLMSGGTLKPDEIKSVLSALTGNSDSSSSDSSSDSGSDDNSI